MVPAPTIRQRLAQSEAEFMMIEADLALTFLDLADTTRIAENRVRQRHQATIACDLVTSALPRLFLTHTQRATLESKLTTIRHRLATP